MSDTLTHKAYWHIHEKLAAGKLQPGSRLSNRGVAREIGVSFTPVREALNRLVSEGLLEHRQGLGVFVPLVSGCEIREIYDLREILESEAAARVCANPTPEVIADLTVSCEAMAKICEQIQNVDSGNAFADQATDWRAIDSAFHMTLLRASGNRRLLDTVEGLQVSLKAMMGGIQNAPVIVGHRLESEPQDRIKDTIERTLEEHCRILESLQTGDTVATKAVMTEHIRTGLELALAAHSRNHMGRTNSFFNGSHQW